MSKLLLTQAHAALLLAQASLVQAKGLLLSEASTHESRLLAIRNATTDTVVAGQLQTMAGSINATISAIQSVDLVSIANALTDPAMAAYQDVPEPEAQAQGEAVATDTSTETPEEAAAEQGTQALAHNEPEAEAVATDTDAQAEPVAETPAEAA